MDRIRILVVGLGSIGKRHLANARRLGCDVAVCRRPEAKEGSDCQPDVPVFPGIEAAKEWGPDIAIVANVTSSHVPTARKAVDMGWHVLIEKPLSHDMVGVGQLIASVQACNVRVGVACNIRFHPAIHALKRAVSERAIGRLLSARAEVGTYLPDWHPEADYRTEYSARRDLGGGAAMTLIHELDYVYWIAGDVCKASGTISHVSGLELDVEDVAEIVCLHKNGAITSIHMDFLDRRYNRRSRWVGETASLDWAWGGPVKLQLADGTDRILWDDPTYDFNDSYVAELTDFIDAVRCGRDPLVPLGDGARVAEIALGATRGKWRAHGNGDAT